MHFVRTLIRGHAALLLPLLALALFVRALVPQGYMPAPREQRLFSIQLCSASSGGRTIDFAVPADDSDHQDGGEHPADMPCAFQALGLTATGAAPAPAPLMLLNLRLLLAQGFAPAIAGHAVRAAASPPPATGPPILR